MEFLKKLKTGNEADKRMEVMLEAMPFAANFWSKEFEHLDCNQEAVRMFEMRDKKDYSERFFELSPEYQPCGTLSRDKALFYNKKAHDEGFCRFDWVHKKLNGELIPCEITIVRAQYGNDYVILGYTRDLREQKKMIAELEQRNKLFKTVNKIATTMLTTMEDEKFDNSLLSGMELICKLMGLDRVQIWQNEMIESELYFVLKYESLSDIGRKMKPVPMGLKYPYSAKPKWKENFLRG